MRIIYDISKAPYENRVVDAQVLCTECKIPKYVELDDEKTYRILVTSYIAGGGDGYEVVKENAMNITTGRINWDFSVVRRLFLFCFVLSCFFNFSHVSAILSFPSLGLFLKH